MGIRTRIAPVAVAVVVVAACGGDAATTPSPTPTSPTETATPPTPSPLPTTPAPTTPAPTTTPTPTEPPIASESTGPPAPVPTPPSPADVPQELPGEPIEFGPRAGDVLAVVGVAHDDRLNLRAAPGTDQAILARLSPTEDAMVAQGATRVIDDRGFGDGFVLWAGVNLGLDI